MRLPKLASMLIPGAALLFAACAPTAPHPPSTADAFASRRAGATLAAAPSVDCGAATDVGETLACTTPDIAALDRRLASVYADALTAPGADTATLEASQRGWIKGRADCWKADDKPACVRESYLTRLVELQVNDGKVVVPTPVEYACDDNRKPFTVVYYNDLDPKAAVITWGDNQAIAFPKPAASGARYGRAGLDFWEHQGEAAVDFYGNKLSCKPKP